MADRTHTPAPWFENGEWLVEPKTLLANHVDACLIATAPDLLDLMQRMVACVDVADSMAEPIDPDVLHELMDEFRAAISKAKGDA